MHWIDWVIVFIPLLIVAYIGFKTQKYVKGVADFLTAGRVAGRYVVSVASGEAALGLISLVAMFETYYKSGFAYGFWGKLSSPIMMVLGLTGFCAYRFRETRAMTMGQFLEIRYSRSFRIFAAVLQSVSGIINYGLFPAVGARFLVYFCDLPLEVVIGGWVFPTFVLVMASFLGIAVFVATMGGQITIMVTDCVQGILSYPFYALIVGYILYRFSWYDDLAPALLNRPPGKSLINPFDIKGLRDFNMFFVFVGILGSILNRMSWSGQQSYRTAAASAHEQKMAGVLGAWRTGFSGMMYILLAVVVFAFLGSDKFTGGPKGSVKCQAALAQKTFDDIASDKKFDTVREEYKNYLTTGKISPPLQARLDKVNADKAKAEAEATKNTDKSKPKEAGPVVKRTGDKEAVLTVGRTAIESVSKTKAQTFATIFGQMRVPMALKYILPVGFVGMFCALCVFLLISTDTTALHSWSSIIVQDLILPIRGKPFTPKQQLRLLRFFMIGVATFAMIFSYFFGQVDYILMFLTIVGTIWLGGAGACIVGGLYWKRGTTPGAYSALISGSTLAVLGVFCQHFWVDTIYPAIVNNGWLESVTGIVEGISAPFEPYVLWRVTPEKFPINSMEVYAITMFTSLGLYIIVSLLTCRKSFNMERMLHRGKYQREGKVIVHKLKGVKDVFRKLVGINEEYSRGDKILALSVFIWAFGRGFLGCFVAVAVWNIFIRPWSNELWLDWFYLNSFIIAGAVAVVSTVWFLIGGTWDLKRLFKRLKEKEVSVLDDGRVIDNVSADDISLVEAVDKVKIEEAHVEEKILEKELAEEGDIEDLENLREHEKEDKPDEGEV